MSNDTHRQSDGPCDIRRADLDSDAGEVLALLDAYAADPMGRGRALDDAVKGRLVAALRQVPGHLVLIARRQGSPVGLVVAFQGFSTFRALPLLNVHDLTVLPAWRRRGIASALLAAVEDEARRRDCCKVTLEVRADNPVAERLYRRLGYGPGDADGQLVAHLFLEKRLGQPPSR